MKSYRHEDDRRILIEWIQDLPMKACKVVIAKGNIEVGNHYHKNKDEVYYLLSGNGEYSLDNSEFQPFEDVLFVPRDIKHTFRLKKDSVLLGACSEPFDASDEIQ